MQQVYHASRVSENPNEFAFDGSYSLKLNENFAMAVALRYIHSDMALNIEDSFIQTINTFAVDLAGFYQSDEMYMGDFNGRLRAGFNISNMGPKVQLTIGGEEDFIPTNLKLGAGFVYGSLKRSLAFCSITLPSTGTAVAVPITLPFWHSSRTDLLISFCAVDLGTNVAS